MVSTVLLILMAVVRAVVLRALLWQYVAVAAVTLDGMLTFCVLVQLSRNSSEILPKEFPAMYIIRNV
jgi:hypothetical protein